jgi:hypothetical protein
MRFLLGQRGQFPPKADMPILPIQIIFTQRKPMGYPATFHAANTIGRWPCFYQSQIQMA